MWVICVHHLLYPELDEHGGTLLAGEAGHVHRAALQVWATSMHDGYDLSVTDCIEGEGGRGGGRAEGGVEGERKEWRKRGGGGRKEWRERKKW